MDQQYCSKRRKRLRFTIGIRSHSVSWALVVLLLSISVISGVSSSRSSTPSVADIWCSLASKARRDLQEFDATREAMKKTEEKGTEESAAAVSDFDRVVRRIGMDRGMNSNSRRNLGGPGSSPPRCTSKCGNCTPCKPVHVPVPPGTPVTAEYYPEAWRCKCGNKLFMP